jgi:hypothetical protein
MRPSVCSLQRRVTSADNYSRKLQLTAKKTRKHDKKRRKHLKPPKKGVQKTPNEGGNMAVAALLALGVLAVLATNGNAAYGQTNKAWFAVMWANDWNFNKKTVVDCTGSALGLGFGGGAYIGTVKYLLSGVARAALIGGLVGFVVVAA